uniref:CUB domain-containing protein n=1 Tax=Strongyloides venezuelensis TaxID=75913 RepID=A0A0K0G428_STRVS
MPTIFTGKECTDLSLLDNKCGKRLLDVDKTKDEHLTVSGMKTCYYRLTASIEDKVQLYIEKTDLIDSEVCNPDQGLEIKFVADKSVSGAVLCGENSEEIIKSENNVLYIKYVGLTHNSTVKIKYRDVE